jgi:excisionase family DNA binding protein
VNDGPTATDYLTVEEAAAEFRVSESALYRALREQRLPGVKILGRWRISRAELLAHVLPEGRVSRRSEMNPMPAPRRQRSEDGFRAKVLELRQRAPR